MKAICVDSKEYRSDSTMVDTVNVKYAGMSPYTYCHNNPIIRIDPTGMADYYDVEGSLICSEDNDDNNKYLVTQYDVEQAIFNGEYIPVPTKSVINQMDKVYEKTDKNQLEYGFRVGTQGSLTHIVEGTGTTKTFDGSGNPLYTPGEISSQLWASTRFEINEANDEEVFYSIGRFFNFNRLLICID